MKRVQRASDGKLPVDVERMSRHLIGLSTAMRLRMSSGLLDRGHDLRPSTAQVIPNLPLDGLRMTDLAARLRLTLQRTGQLVFELEEVHCSKANGCPPHHANRDRPDGLTVCGDSELGTRYALGQSTQ